MTLIRRPGVALVTLLFLLLGAAFITQVVPYRQIIDSQRQVTAAQERLATLASSAPEPHVPGISALEIRAQSGA